MTEEQLASILTEELKKSSPKEIIKRGDVVRLGWGSKYRNGDKFMWDGHKVVLLNYDMDDYGSVSLDFKFPEFRPDYFVDSIDHNNIVNFTEDKIDEIKSSFDPASQQSYVTDNYNKYIITQENITSLADIKFDKIILEDDVWLEYNKYNRRISFEPQIYQSSTGSKNYYEVRIDFPDIYKNSIISVLPKNDKTEYKWDDDTLILTEYN